MKQTWIVFLLIMLAALPGVAAVITVKTPVAGESIVIGAAKPITWTFSGLPETTKVLIVLWRNGSKLGAIAQDQGIGSSGQGSYGWTAGTCAGKQVAAGTCIQGRSAP